MRSSIKCLAACAFAWAAAATPASAVTQTSTTINGLAVDQFKWRDSKGLTRSVALKKQGSGNPGNGGYAVRMTYFFTNAQGQLVNRVASSTSGEGFGYFVSHERYRAFNDGDSAPIANKIFGQDDSPLGRQFPVTASPYKISRSDLKGITYQLNYPRYGTKAANGIDPDTGEDSPKLGTAQSLFTRYTLKVLISWVFQDGRDFPRIRTLVIMSDVPGADRVSFDLRGPYGVIDFEEGNKVISQVTWGDRYHFLTTTTPLTRNSQWTWNVVNKGARYTSLTAGTSEMGLLEPTSYGRSSINDGFAFGRGKTWNTHDAAGAGCAGQELPCDYEWPYQSAQYSLPYDNPNGTTTYEKLAWGSTPYYGTSLASTYDGTQSVPFIGFPANKAYQYDVCVVLGERIAGGLARTVAGASGTYNCAGVQ